MKWAHLCCIGSWSLQVFTFHEGSGNLPGASYSGHQVREHLKITGKRAIRIRPNRYQIECEVDGRPMSLVMTWLEADRLGLTKDDEYQAMEEGEVLTAL